MASTMASVTSFVVALPPTSGVGVPSPVTRSTARIGGRRHAQAAAWIGDVRDPPRTEVLACLTRNQAAYAEQA